MFLPNAALHQYQNIIRVYLQVCKIYLPASSKYQKPPASYFVLFTQFQEKPSQELEGADLQQLSQITIDSLTAPFDKEAVHLQLAADIFNRKVWISPYCFSLGRCVNKGIFSSGSHNG